MGCLKLTYYYPQMQALRARKPVRSREAKSAQWFTTIDPLAENHYNISPYAYCMNNPIRYIDPLGMDTLDFDHTGHLTGTRTGGDDILNVTNSKGKVVSKTFKAGTFKDYGSGNYNGNEYVYLSGDNAKNSKAMFEFLADNTDVEWGNSSFGDGQNFVTTSHEGDVESGSTFLTIDKGLYNNAALLKYDHSHPIVPGDPRRSSVDQLNYPSGLPDSNSAGIGDIEVLRGRINHAMKNGQSIPSMRIYLQGKGYRSFDLNSTLKQFNNLPTWYYEW